MTIKPKLAAILLTCLMLGSSMSVGAAKQEQEQRIQGLEQKIDALMSQIARICGTVNKPEGSGTQKAEAK